MDADVDTDWTDLSNRSWEFRVEPRETSVSMEHYDGIEVVIVETEMARTSIGVISAVNTARQDTILLCQDMQSRQRSLEALVITQIERTREHLNY